MFYGKIREDETAVEFEEGKGLRATDDDKIGAAGINIDNILITLYNWLLCGFKRKIKNKFYIFILKK